MEHQRQAGIIARMYGLIKEAVVDLHLDKPNEYIVVFYSHLLSEVYSFCWIKVKS